jgi:hypothetical protein
MIQWTAVAKISHRANKRGPSTRRGDRRSPIRRLRPVWLLRPPGLVRSPSVPAAVHQPSKASAGAIQSSPPPQIIGPHPPSRSPPPCRPRHPPGALPLRSLGQAAARRGHRDHARPLSTAPAAIPPERASLQASGGVRRYGHRSMGRVIAPPAADPGHSLPLVALVPQWRRDYPNKRPPTRATAISEMGQNRPPALQKR